MAEYLYLIAPECRGWVVLIRSKSSEEAAMMAMVTMVNCDCDMHSARYAGPYEMMRGELLGWTFQKSGCKSKSNG